MRHIILLAALLCAACSSALPSFKPYKMDIQQGNVVTSKMMLQLRPGMTKSQVRFIMGSPLIQDSFHRDRWDYFYQMRKGGKIIEQRRVIMEFENDALKRVRGDVVPASPEDTAVTAATPAAPIVVEPKAPEKKGMLDRLKFWKSDDEQPSGAEYYDMKPTVPVVQEDPVAPRKVVPELAAPGAPPAAVPVPAQPSAGQPATQAVPATPAAKPATGAAAATQSAPDVDEEDDDDLPPEDEPGYFERMLEKIGF
ncbi:outer membrane protein assembly factor BamE [Methylobacillus flagellatus]|uniref:outer membrane protein assembly factor BamE n=1 Tax=Methylobacillus flagellatus TaxID=405 RepID=UPI002853C3A4|nr:outer membrane protein assembly factor BamE [Methylobacillus flagellatus]MDR5170863.1 outer membrane protein assembly factor BamE [Methylobacillus flagellatus]